MPIFMKYDGIDGDVTERDHKGWIELSSVQWGATNAGASGGGGTGAGKASFSDVSISKRSSAGSTKLFLFCANGKTAKSVVIEVLRQANNGRLNLVQRYSLTDASVSAFTVGSDGESAPFEEGALKFSAIKFEHAVRMGDGSVRIESAFWDLKKNTGG